jgi:hypothetical protein
MSGEPPSLSPARRPLHERSDSDSNAHARTLRLVENSPQFLRQTDDVFGRTPLPTHPSHILLPGRGKGNGKGTDHALSFEFQHASRSQAPPDSTGSPVSTAYTLAQPPIQSNPSSPTGSFVSRPKPPAKKRLQVHQDSKTFSLVPQDEPLSVEQSPRFPRSPISRTVSIKSSDGLQTSREERITEAEPASTPPPLSPSPPGGDPVVPSTPSPEPEQEQEQASPNHTATSPWNYHLVGGLRKVAATPDLKAKTTAKVEHSPLPPTPEAPAAQSHALITKPSFQSTGTATTTSENTNYKVYRDISPSTSEAAPASPSSANSNYQLHGEPSPESSVIYRPQTSTSSSENENYELLGDPSPSTSLVHIARPGKYSQESLVVPPLNPRAKRSNENLGYYKSRSRESLRTGSLTSISTVLSQQEASQAIAGSGALIHVPNPNSQVRVADSWADIVGTNPLRSHMNEYPHQWSSQLSTVHSVSEGGTDRGSRAWSDDNGRRSSGFPSTPSRHSRQMLSISSSLAQDDDARGTSLSPPPPAHTRDDGRVMGEQDEHGDVITDMTEIRDLRTRPSRRRMSGGLYSIASSDNGRTSTMRSTGSSRANSLLASTIPTWARLYYGSGEWRALIARPGTASEASESRNNSFRSRSGSPVTDHFPQTLHSPRRRPREISNNEAPPQERDSLEITPAPDGRRDGRSGTAARHTTTFRTWSMSSIWSPHLRTDRRAVTRSGVYGPPSVTWSTEGRFFGRRNAQVLLFVVGFIFPLCT